MSQAPEDGDQAIIHLNYLFTQQNQIYLCMNSIKYIKENIEQEMSVLLIIHNLKQQVFIMYNDYLKLKVDSK